MVNARYKNYAVIIAQTVNEDLAHHIRIITGSLKTKAVVDFGGKMKSSSNRSTLNVVIIFSNGT